MTGSWTMDGFIIGCIILLVLPVIIWVYVEKIKKGGNNS
jgi:hypothetical protein